MKKSIFVCAACLTIAGTYVYAQKHETKTPHASLEQLAPPPPPPAPPAPPAPPVFAFEAIPAPPPLPPVPPVAPIAPIAPLAPDAPEAPATPEAPEAPEAPPAPPVLEKSIYVRPVVINSIGYDLTVQLIKGEEVVIVKKKGYLQKIKMSTWMEGRKHYEKKYGLLPPSRAEKPSIPA